MPQEEKEDFSQINLDNSVFHFVILATHHGSRHTESSGKSHRKAISLLKLKFSKCICCQISFEFDPEKCTSGHLL